jgi:hypothetical protein
MDVKPDSLCKACPEAARHGESKGDIWKVKENAQDAKL